MTDLGDYQPPSSERYDGSLYHRLQELRRVNQAIASMAGTDYEDDGPKQGAFEAVSCRQFDLWLEILRTDVDDWRGMIVKARVLCEMAAAGHHLEPEYLRLLADDIDRLAPDLGLPARDERLVEAVS